MARISFVHPDDVTDPEMKQWLLEAIENDLPGPENQAMRAHNKVVMRSFTLLRQSMIDEGVLEPELRELMRARMSTSWDRMFGMPACHY